MKKLLLVGLLFCSTAFADNTYKIQVVTKEYVPEVGVEYTDAQYFEAPDLIPLAVWKMQNEATINTEKKERIARYVEAIKNPPVQKELTKEELLQEQASIAEQKAALDLRISEIDAKVAELEAKPVKDEEPIVEEKPILDGEIVK